MVLSGGLDVHSERKESIKDERLLFHTACGKKCLLLTEKKTSIFYGVGGDMRKAKGKHEMLYRHI